MGIEKMIEAVHNTSYSNVRGVQGETEEEREQRYLEQAQDLYETVSMLEEAQAFIEAHGLKKEYEEGRKQSFE